MCPGGAVSEQKGDLECVVHIYSCPLKGELREMQIHSFIECLCVPNTLLEAGD